MRLLQAAALCAALALGGCASAGSVVASLAVSATSSSPTQVTTLADAVLATSAVEKGLDALVVSGTLSKPVLRELTILVPALHNTLAAAETANASGNSAAIAAGLAAFNEALKAVKAYETLNGVS